MTTVYEIRNPRLDGIFISFDREPHALDWWREYVKNAPRTGIHFGAVVVKHMYETDAEAETARLDFMISDGSIAKFSRACLALDPELLKNADDWPKAARLAIDCARGSPSPITTVIWPVP